MLTICSVPTPSSTATSELVCVLVSDTVMDRQSPHRPHKKARHGETTKSAWADLVLCNQDERSHCPSKTSWSNSGRPHDNLLGGSKAESVPTNYQHILPKTGVENEQLDCLGIGPRREQSQFAPVASLPAPEASWRPNWEVPTFEGGAVKHDEAGSVVKDEITVCYGLVTDIPSTLDCSILAKGNPEFTVELLSGHQFLSANESGIAGRIKDPSHNQMIQSLLEEPDIYLRACCYPDDRHSTRKSIVQHCTLEIAIYGPYSQLDDVGQWFQDYEVYLQDPKHCHEDVRYCNPHRLSSANLDDCLRLSEFVSKRQDFQEFQKISDRRDVLDVFSTRQDLEEAGQPTAIATALKRHQKQALTFMLQRERGWDFRSAGEDVWEILDSGDVPVFHNTVSNLSQTDEPPQFYGGVVADTMGLGKSLTMISLVATDLEIKSPNLHFHDLDAEEFIGRISTPATLVVVPPPLISTWEEQIAQHVRPERIRVHLHHGKTRLQDPSLLRHGDIVLTTFHTISADWGPTEASRDSIIFKCRWKRIILDEAHFIKNGNARMTKAICALEAVSRWAVTGTPIQNRLSDLATLLQFIRPFPYGDPRCFDTDITQLWKSGQGAEAVERLKQLSACLVLRRNQGTIELPPRTNLLCPVDFTQNERKAYQRIREHAIARIDEALGGGQEQQGTHGSYVNALQQIEALRLFSDLGLHYHTRPSATNNLENWQQQAQGVLHQQCEMGPVVCIQCSSAIDLTELATDANVSSQHGPKAHFFSCLRYICSNCIDDLGRSKRSLSCGHTKQCSLALVSPSLAAGDADCDGIAGTISHFPTSVQMPSKVKALVADIRTVPPDVKCIVFSTWRLSLDLVEQALNQASITTVRFDGKVAQKDRQPIINKFQSDPLVRVMLLTLSCGAVGLTLTAASRAYLLEPHWNPTLEDQALARVHRLGQERPVTTIRLYMRDSFEEEVMKVQDSKRDLAGILLSPHDGTQTDTSLGTLERLRSLL
ncbi:SMARC subfamily A3 [Microdochium nivale]|nr:SMARC subfamily A3 [Microdochium nivale]